jgi:hypothetical protein
MTVPFDGRSYPREALVADAPTLLGVSSATALSALGSDPGFITLGEAKALVGSTTVDPPFASGLVSQQGTARLLMGAGAPSKPGGVDPVAGDFYLRTGTPSTANQRLYVCTVGGASPTWVGVV